METKIDTTKITPSIKFQNIDKRFPGVHALDEVSFECMPGTVHVLQGENGAGKSTLLKILTGIYKPDSGQIYINGKCVRFLHPQDARRYGISMVYQELSLLPELTVAQNIFLNHKQNSVLLNEKKMIESTRQITSRYGVELDPYARTGDLTIANQQMVEIFKALALDPQILILDEPTSTLTQIEVSKLYSIVQEFKENGKTVLFISHRIEEVFQFGDTVTILKDGNVIDTVQTSEVDENRIIQLMVGRKLQNIFPQKNEENSEKVTLSVENIGDNKNLHNINFCVHSGEIVGIGALEGQGQTELFQILGGLRHSSTGIVRLGGKSIAFNNVRKALRNGIGYVPEDRKRQGLCVSLSVGSNLSMASLYLRQTFGWIHKKEEQKQSKIMIDQLNIKMSSLLEYTNNLSGGNQQKVSIGKILGAKPKVLLLNEPTRGIDVEAKQEIYKIIRNLANNGVAILCYTSDMMETIGLCDRVLTFYEGNITGELSGADITEENILRGAMNQSIDTLT